MPDFLFDLKERLLDLTSTMSPQRWIGVLAALVLGTALVVGTIIAAPQLLSSQAATTPQIPPPPTLAAPPGTNTAQAAASLASASTGCRTAITRVRGLIVKYPVFSAVPAAALPGVRTTLLAVSHACTTTQFNAYTNTIFEPWAAAAPPTAAHRSVGRHHAAVPPRT